MPRFKADATPKYRKHRACRQAIVTLSGRDHYLGPHGTEASRREYDRLVAEWIAGGRLTLAAQQQKSIMELLVAYLKHAKFVSAQNSNSTRQ